MTQRKMRKVALYDQFFFYLIGKDSVKIRFPDDKSTTVPIHRILSMTEAEYIAERKSKSPKIRVTPCAIRDWIKANGKTDERKAK